MFYLIKTILVIIIVFFLLLLLLYLAFIYVFIDSFIS
jgi:hypothetical protein